MLVKFATIVMLIIKHVDLFKKLKEKEKSGDDGKKRPHTKSDNYGRNGEMIMNRDSNNSIAYSLFL